jgi:2-keto-myo-inositol isomerase
MPKQTMDRRNALGLMGVSAGAAFLKSSAPPVLKPGVVQKPAFTFCLNMATIRGHKLGFVKELETASRAGFGSVEIWMDSLQAYLQSGGTLIDAKKRLNDMGLKVENSISFAKWIVDHDSTRKEAVEQRKREMELLAQIGCKRMAATGAGAGFDTGVEPRLIAERYRVILELSDHTGVIPLLEMWGFMKNVSKVSEVLYAAMESGHPNARVLLDVFHLFKGNTPLDTLHLMNPMANDILHMNDYNDTLSREIITDADRIYPGDGVAPLKNILQILKRDDQPLILSCEVFNKTYYNDDALNVAKTSLSKMKTVVDMLDQ